MQRFGPDFLKEHQWDAEFSDGQWDYLENSGDVQVYRQIERYVEKGSVLDLGCGPGTTGVELDFECYSTYVGVDISEVAIKKARTRAEQCGRSTKNRYFQANILSYEPSEEFNVIFFGESIYYVRFGQIVPMLQRYTKYLVPKGVILVRVFDIRTATNGRIFKEIADNFDVIAQDVEPDYSALFVFREKRLGSV